MDAKHLSNLQQAHAAALAALERKNQQINAAGVLALSPEGLAATAQALGQNLLLEQCLRGMTPLLQTMDALMTRAATPEAPPAPTAPPVVETAEVKPVSKLPPGVKLKDVVFEALCGTLVHDTFAAIDYDALAAALPLANPASIPSAVSSLVADGKLLTAKRDANTPGKGRLAYALAPAPVTVDAQASSPEVAAEPAVVVVADAPAPMSAPPVEVLVELAMPVAPLVDATPEWAMDD